MRQRHIIITLLSLISLLAVGGWAVAAPQMPMADPVPAQEMDLTTLYETVAPSVVYIEVISRGESMFGEGLMQSVGSGFVVDMQGHIVTNFHVVHGAEAGEIIVTFFDGTFARASIVGLDPDSDLAVIEVNVDPSILRPVAFADSDQVRVGQDVVAIGNPFQQSWTMTTGIISALGRTNPSLRQFSIAQMIQTDAAINPGNSGGPLLDRQGRVIGVNSMINSEDRANSGVGFAVPSNTVTRVLPDLIATGSYQYTWLGIQGYDVSIQVIEELGLDPSIRGVVVSSVISDGPAARSGLAGARYEGDTGLPLGGDIIIALDGTPIRTIDSLINYLAANTVPGDQMTVTVLREGQTVDILVTLQARPE